jgi:CheY-like chemotaxis protein
VTALRITPLPDLGADGETCSARIRPASDIADAVLDRTAHQARRILPPEQKHRSALSSDPVYPRDGVVAKVRPQVLIADDDPIVLETTVELLNLCGVSVRAAKNGSEAVRMASEQLPDVVLLDLSMPIMSGYEACRRIRQLAKGSPVVRVALTARGTVEDRQASAAAGFSEHWTKPVSSELLLTLVTRLGARRG